MEPEIEAEHAARSGAPAPILEVINVTKRFPNGRTVLNGISFEVFPEETFVILGGSGCGKSTLLNILIGVLPPSSGEIRIFGRDLRAMNGEQVKEMHVRCGMLFQSGALIESLSLLGNVHLPLREHYRKMDPAILMETARLKLRMVGLEEHGSKRPSGISGGMKKRVALARALALDPDLVFADEPTSGLDPVSTQEIDEMFIRLTRRIGAAAVVVTHDIASFFRIAHRAVMLGGERDCELQGRVIMQGGPDEFRASTNPIVKRFFSLGPGRLVDGPF
jgi:phospholipid/cholesterol/gamma-HCH transport system ATP-binding protein